ncbi:ATP-binding cassette domain-containing protein [Marinobacterium aestuariivivens]|uniref:ATP-binding cassette domain-containing protein n=1 Tax=Marinobacterium aestuariivivens TaxID=1698799 RepID=A0ABW2A6Q9_9GAMM
MLEIDDLDVMRDGARLHYRLQVDAGEILAIQGRSGVGKTTLLDAIAGFEEPLAGDIRWQRRSLLGQPAERRPVSMLFQDHNLFEHLSVHDNLRLGFGDRIPEDRLLNACERLGVATLLARRPGELSGGQRQRVALIRTLLRPEPIVLLDEPFAELDPETRETAARWTRQTAREDHKTLLLVTHQDEDVRLVADRALNLSWHG